MRIPVLLFFVFLGAALAEEPGPCVFCEIVGGGRAAVIVLREANVVAFMDNSPRNPGHVLVVPVTHADNLLEAPTDTLREMMAVAQRIARAIRKAGLPSEGIQLQMNTGKPAGQTVFHAHLHIIPRYAGEPEKPAEKFKAPLSELEAVAAKIRAALE